MGEQLKISLVVTVFNEEEMITPLLDSLWEQTFKPDEIIIVDAGSTDKTVDLINRWKEDHKITVHLFELPGLNRSKGRNYGIGKAKNVYIVVTDAGCVAHKDWLATLARVWQQDGYVGAVAGFYEMKPMNSWQKIFQYYLGVTPEQMNEETYLPSSRSLALTKEAWRDVGGYPEKLETCEDLVFAARLKKTVKMKVAKKALVRWYLPADLLGFFAQVAGYAAGDVQAKYWPHLKTHLLVWLRYGVFVYVPWLLLLYLVYPWFKLRKYGLDVRLGAMAAIVQVASDMAVMWGGITGLVG